MTLDEARGAGIRPVRVLFPTFRKEGDQVVLTTGHEDVPRAEAIRRLSGMSAARYLEDILHVGVVALLDPDAILAWWGPDERRRQLSLMAEYGRQRK
jgi:hypothetical protein